MSHAKCTFPEWHFENFGGFWAPKWTQKGKETEHQFRVDFGCPFWPTWSHFSGPRGVSNPCARWPPPGRPPIFLTVRMHCNYSRTLKVLFPSPRAAKHIQAIFIPAILDPQSGVFALQFKMLSQSPRRKKLRTPRKKLRTVRRPSKIMVLAETSLKKCL